MKKALELIEKNLIAIAAVMMIAFIVYACLNLTDQIGDSWNHYFGSTNPMLADCKLQIETIRAQLKF